MPISRSIVRAAGAPLVGTSPTETRLALAAFVSRAASAAWGARPGVLWGGAVSGTAGWAYNVAPAALITTRGALEGVYPSANTGVSSVPTDPAPASGSRIDIVYALQQDTDVGDLGNAALLGVAIGAASGAPTPPSIPAGALELGRNTMTSTATTTASAGNTITSTAPFTALAGGVYEVPTVASLTRIVSPGNLDLARVGTDDLYIYRGGSWKPLFGDTGWIDTGISYLGNWSSFGGIFPVRYRIKREVVYWNGLVRRDANLAGGAASTMFTVPPAARPDFRKVEGCMSNITWPTGAASAGTAHTHAIIDDGSLGPTVRVTIDETTGGFQVVTAPNMPFVTGQWVSLADIRPYPAAS